MNIIFMKHLYFTMSASMFNVHFGFGKSQMDLFGVMTNVVQLCQILSLCAFLQMDHLTGMSNLSLGGTATSHTQSMQSFQTSLTSALSNPLSPAKAFPPLPNPNPSTPFGGINISSQLPAMDSGTKRFDFILFF